MPNTIVTVVEWTTTRSGRPSFGRANVYIYIQYALYITKNLIGEINIQHIILLQNYKRQTFCGCKGS